MTFADSAEVSSSLLMKATLAGILLVLAGTPLALGQSANGSFNPQTEFPIGSSVTINSVSGLGGGPFPTSFVASLTLTATVTNNTAHGDIVWTITGGSIVENETTLTIIGGGGGIGKLDRILIVGNATDPNGHAYDWGLEGLAIMYNGTVIASLNGASGYNPNPTTPTIQQPSLPNRKANSVPLSFVATVN